MGGFKSFVIRGNLVDLAVAVVIGTAFASLVKDFSGSFITPLIALFGGKPDYTDLAFTINGTTFPYGNFITSALSFLITAAIVYFLVVLPTAKLLERLDRRDPTDQECPECLSEVPLRARRCRYCTSPLPETKAPGV
ncbi:large conductance mechanosensitive channel protein MscL [Actinomadura flavalba]|uniref:large conductance mechanosensitive channel protein MscL n=1 Tax=Actinomadura flavalba TaxID=1120938 RepID=UPI000379A102|nr:large conductance mechanosensitive channel protein MscL [Actinomadura flavalba]